jgi:hypothetical protein
MRFVPGSSVEKVERAGRFLIRERIKAKRYHYAILRRE